MGKASSRSYLIGSPTDKLSHIWQFSPTPATQGPIRWDGGWGAICSSTFQFHIASLCCPPDFHRMSPSSHECLYSMSVAGTSGFLPSHLTSPPHTHTHTMCLSVLCGFGLLLAGWFNHHVFKTQTLTPMPNLLSTMHIIKFLLQLVSGLFSPVLPCFSSVLTCTDPFWPPFGSDLPRSPPEHTFLKH